ncbi:MAG: DUF4837 family protein [Bacteroidales bacterium]|nr:DUF4837 family protein [Bacteroidales bacterium]
MKKYILSILISVLFFNSCNREKTRTSLLPNVTGKAGEVILVMNTNLWESDFGDNFKKLLSQEHISLPQSEPIFNLVQIPQNAFSDIFKLHRNIIYTTISNNIKKPEIFIKKDVWAKPQLYIKMVAPDNESFKKLFEENNERILANIIKIERERIITNYKKYEEKSLRNLLTKYHNISLCFPKGYRLRTDTTNFTWISHETPDISQGIFIYYYDYTDTNTFTLDYLLSKRDSFLQMYVPGPSESSFMTTEHLFNTSFKEFKFNEQYTVELRGLWKLKGDYMGGPFVSFSTVDEKRNRIITVEGYVYAPMFDKRNYIRQVEGILYTFKIID